MSSSHDSKLDLKSEKAPAEGNPVPEGVSEEELQAGTIDFNEDGSKSAGSGSSVELGEHVPPSSGASVVSWADVLRQRHPKKSSDDEVILGSLAELQIDSVSDNDILKHLAAEGLQAATNRSGVLRVGPAANGDSPAEAEAPEDQAAPKPYDEPAPASPDNEKWYLKTLKPDINESSSVNLNDAAPVANQALQEGQSAPRAADEADALAGAMYPDDGTSRVNLGMEPRISGLLSDSVAAKLPPSPAPVRPKPPSRPQLRMGDTKRSWLGGMAVGSLLALSLAVAVWSTGWLSPGKKSAIREPDPSAVSSLTTPEMSKPDDATRRQLAELLASQQRLDEALQTVSTKLNAEKMEDVVPALDGLITARQKAEEDHRQAEKKWRQAQGDLNQANQTLEALRKSGLEEVKVTQARLDEAVNREKEARQMIAELVAARKEADESFRSVAEKLRSAKILGEKTDRQSVLKSIDDLIGREDLNAKAEIAHLRRTLERSRSPGQMLDFWPVMLEHNTPADLAAAALADADAVFTDPQTPEDSKAKALAVKALALLAQEDFTAARVVLGQAGRTTALNGDAGWTARLKKANAELSDSTALREQVRRYLAHGHPSEALAAADRGLKIFPKSAYRKDYHRVLGLRAECLLQLNRLDEAEKDATVALETGLTADGHFTLGRVAERRRQWAVAKEHLSRAFAEAKQPEQVKPIRIALARVLSGPEAGDSDLAQASQLADQAIAAGQPEAYLVKSRVFQRQKKFSEALEASLLALKALAPEEYGDNWAALVREHPGLREDLVLSIAKADPVAAERLFGTGMRLYFAHQFSAAETQLLEAIKNNPNDARYYYFLGLSRVPQGKTDEAEKVLWRAVALERQGMPDTDAVNTYLERVQGPERNWINRVRRP